MGCTFSTVLVAPSSNEKNAKIINQINNYKTKHEFVHDWTNFEDVYLRIQFLGQILPSNYPDRIETIHDYIFNIFNNSKLQWITRDVIQSIITNIDYSIDLTQNKQLKAELLNFSLKHNKPICKILIPDEDKCKYCGTRLYLIKNSATLSI